MLFFRSHFLDGSRTKVACTSVRAAKRNGETRERSTLSVVASPSNTGLAFHLSLSLSLSFFLFVLVCAVLCCCAVLLTVFDQRKQGLKEKKQQQEKAAPAAAAPDADVVELVAPHSGSDLGKWEPDVRVPPTVATLR